MGCRALPQHFSVKVARGKALQAAQLTSSRQQHRQPALQPAGRSVGSAAVGPTHALPHDTRARTTTHVPPPPLARTPHLHPGVDVAEERQLGRADLRQQHHLHRAMSIRVMSIRVMPIRVMSIRVMSIGVMSIRVMSIRVMSIRVMSIRVMQIRVMQIRVIESCRSESPETCPSVCVMGNHLGQPPHRDPGQDCVRRRACVCACGCTTAGRPAERRRARRRSRMPMLPCRPAATSESAPPPPPSPVRIPE